MKLAEMFKTNNRLCIGNERPRFSIVHPTAPRILIALGWYDHRLQRGIERYGREHGWQISIDVAREKVVPWGWEGDGILAWLGADDELAEFVSRARKPTVDFSFRRPRLKFTRVLEDTAGTGRLVAGHLLTRGLRTCLFYSDCENWIYNERGSHFLQCVRRAGREGHWLRWHASPEYCSDQSAWKVKRRWLMEQIRQAEKPVGIFAASDGLALEVLEICEEVEIRVPEEAAIVGAGDSLLAVNAMSTPISSVDTNLEMLGYRGAQELDRLIHKKSTAPVTIRVPAVGMIVRKSSDVLAVSRPGIARSLRFLWENCHQPLTVEKLAKIASMSKRSFHQTFIECTGRRPGEEIYRARVEQAKRLLAGSREKLSVIARKCGYRASNSLSVAFKNTTGMSPTAYRGKWTAPESSVSTEKSGASTVIVTCSQINDRLVSLSKSGRNI